MGHKGRRDEGIVGAGVLAWVLARLNGCDLGLFVTDIMCVKAYLRICHHLNINSSSFSSSFIRHVINRLTVFRLFLLLQICVNVSHLVRSTLTVAAWWGGTVKL